MIREIILLIILTVTTPAAAQRLSVQKKEIDCGKTLYQQPVRCTFALKNKSMRRLVIHDVKTSCGCASVTYPKEGIGIGDKFEISMTYDGRMLGHYIKQMAVYSNASTDPLILTMKGIVVDELQDYSGTFPFEMGDLRLDMNNLEFDNVNKGEKPAQEIHVMNTGDKSYQPILMHLPNYLSATVTPERIAPGHAGTIMVTLLSRNLHNYGLTQTRLFLAPNPGDKVSHEREINVSAVLLPAFEGLTSAARLFAPKMKLSSDTLKLDFAGKKKKSGEILITNEGRTDLEIRSLQMFTNGIKVTLQKKIVQPKETVKLKITGYAEELKTVRTKPRVLMITNDPDYAKAIINIEYENNATSGEL